MATSITFDDDVDDMDDGGRDPDQPVLVDALVPPFGWIPAQKVTERSVRFLDEPSVHDCIRMAPLYSRSLRSSYESSAVRQGQGVTVELDPNGDPLSDTDAGTRELRGESVGRVRGIVEAVDDLGEVIVRTLEGSTVRLPRSAVHPFFSVTPASTLTSHPGVKRSYSPGQDTENSLLPSLYVQSLLRQNLAKFSIRGDGNCLFRAASHQVYGTDEYHMIVRQACANYMALEKAYFEPFVAEASGRSLGRSPYSGFEQYVAEIRMNGVWGDDPELQAICELYQRRAEVYYFDRVKGEAKILRRLNEGDSILNRSVPLRLSFQGGGHYDSIVEARPTGASVARPKPGVLETRTLEIARARRAGGVHMASKLSDETETERIQVEEALMRSRQTLDKERRAHGYNLQEALELSLKTVAQEETDAMEKARIQSLRETEDEQLARVLAESMKDTRGPVHNIGYIEDEEDELIRLAIAESLKM